MSNVGIIIEARTQSTRFRNKIFKKFGKFTILNFLIKRLKKNLNFDVIVATSLNNKDKKIENFCKKNKISYFRGKEHDLIDRIINAADHFNINIIISLTSDNPLVDPKMIKKMLNIFQKNNLDYFDNLNTNYLPRGTAIRIIKKKVLSKYSYRVKNTSKYNYRQHTTYFFIKNKNKKIFKTTKFQIYKKYSLPGYSFTIDYEQDYQKIKKLLKNFSFNVNIDLFKIIQFLKKTNKYYSL